MVASATARNQQHLRNTAVAIAVGFGGPEKIDEVFAGPEESLDSVATPQVFDAEKWWQE